jgi:hypothetical protein
MVFSIVSSDISRMNPELEADYSDFLRFREVPPKEPFSLVAAGTRRSSEAG